MAAGDCVSVTRYCAAGKSIAAIRAEILLAPGDAVGLAVGVRYPGDQVRREEFTHPVQVPGIEGLEQVRCDVDGMHRFTM